MAIGDVLSVLITPIMLMFFLPQDAERIVAFYGDNTTEVPGLGDHYIKVSKQLLADDYHRVLAHSVVGKSAAFEQDPEEQAAGAAKGAATTAQPTESSWAPAGSYPLMTESGTVSRSVNHTFLASARSALNRSSPSIPALRYGHLHAADDDDDTPIWENAYLEMSRSHVLKQYADEEGDTS